MVKTQDENSKEGGRLGTGSRFQQIAEALFEGNKSDLARALDMKPGSFTKYLRGDRTPGASVLERLTRMGVNINWFLTGEGTMILPDEELSSPSSPEQPRQVMSAAELQRDPAQFYPIPFVQVRATDDGAVRLDEMGEPEWVSEHRIREQYDMIEPERLRTFRVSCNRMADTVRTGDLVRGALLPANVSIGDLVEGGIYLLFGPEGVIVMRVQVVSDTQLQLCGENPNVPDRTVTREQWGTVVRPIARVLEVIRSL